MTAHYQAIKRGQKASPSSPPQSPSLSLLFSYSPAALLRPLLPRVSYLFFGALPGAFLPTFFPPVAFLATPFPPVVLFAGALPEVVGRSELLLPTLGLFVGGCTSSTSESEDESSSITSFVELPVLRFVERAEARRGLFAGVIAGIDGLVLKSVIGVEERGSSLSDEERE